MRYTPDRQQDEKSMSFETSGALDEREAFAYCRNGNFSSMPLERLRLAELKDAISAAWDVRKKLRLSIGQFERKFSSLEMAHFFPFFFYRTFSEAPYLH